MILTLIQNVSLLITLTFFYAVLVKFRVKREWKFQLSTGVWFGLVAIAGMTMPYVYEPGVIFDGRSIVLTLAGLFGGTIPAILAMSLAALFRLSIGGPGVFAGLTTILLCTWIGLFFRWRFSGKPERIPIFFLFVIGLISHIGMLCCQLLFPWPHGLTVIGHIWLPVMLIFPAAFMLVGVLLISTEKYLQNVKLLQDAEQRYRNLFNSIRDPILLTDTSGNITGCNASFPEYFGYSPEEIEGKEASILYENEQEFRQLVDSLTIEDGGSPLSYSTNFKRKDFSTFPGEIILYYRTGMDGNVIGHMSLIRDISERKKAEIILLESEKKYRTLIEISQDAIFINQNITITYLNPAALRLFGADKPEQILGKSPFEVFHPDFHRIIKQRISEMTFNETTVPLIEEKIIRLDGTVVDVEVSATSFEWMGETAIQVVLRDITERKEAEEALRNSDRIFNHALDMICIAGFDGYFKVLNPSWSRVLGWSNEELLAKPWLEFVHPDDKVPTMNIGLSIIDGREAYLFENRYICKDGSEKWLAWSSFPYPEEKVMYGIARDITEKKQIEQSLKESQEKLSMMKDELELKVREKTIELEERIAELERFKKATIDREIRMKELREEILKLKKS